MTALALAALAFIAYTYAGYPLLVAVWARLRPRPSRGREEYEPTVSVCLAAHDGERYLPAKIRSLQALAYPAHKLEILIRSDGSNDRTEDLARELAATDPRIRVFSTPTRSGKPSALNLLARQARGEVLLMTDVRQPLSPNALRELVRPLADPSVGCVSGSLVLAGDTGPSAYWRYERFIRGAEARLGWMVGVSGSLYAIRRADLDEMPADVLLDDMWVPLSVARWSKRTVLAEDARAYDEACDDGREFARKVRTLAGNYQLVAKMPWLLVPGRNPVWFQLLSHKLCRLVCPWALVALLAASATLAYPSNPVPPGTTFWRVLLAAQVSFYALAALGPHAGRVGNLARTFTVLHAAAVVGLWRFARRTQPVTW